MSLVFPSVLPSRRLTMAVHVVAAFPFWRRYASSVARHLLARERVFLFVLFFRFCLFCCHHMPARAFFLFLPAPFFAITHELIGETASTRDDGVCDDDMSFIVDNDTRRFIFFLAFSVRSGLSARQNAMAARDIL